MLAKNEQKQNYFQDFFYVIVDQTLWSLTVLYKVWVLMYLFKKTL